MWSETDKAHLVLLMEKPFPCALAAHFDLRTLVGTLLFDPCGYLQRKRFVTPLASSKAFANSRIICRLPPLNPRIADRRFPSSLVGPVDFSHGRHCRIKADCLTLRSGVQPLAMICLLQ